MKKYLICCLPLLVAAAPSSDKLKTGQWEETVQNMVMQIDGKNTPTDSKTKSVLHCVTEEDNDPRVVFAKTPDHCKNSQLEIKGGNFTVKQECSPEAKVPFHQMTVKGSYTPTNYKMSYSIMAGPAEHPMTISADTTAHYVGACPVPTESPDATPSATPQSPK
ncbi:MAG: DUF3617 family protein [Zymomonas mobilis]|uniref:Uncharacterized protein DUF3617 n=1 Tax=Zymomonas mobilis TaxID=542 RepID=A0A542W2C1_ZYMMB|nr:DUF3617 family protein [Zymomonas mobilis]TQL17619.1 uncharacterized protein DUF3617 [Zymomonas mobilis]